jgi:hypothetical protein
MLNPAKEPDSSGGRNVPEDGFASEAMPLKRDPILGYQKQELRVPIDSNGFNAIAEQTSSNFQKTSTRTDFYFDIYNKDGLILRGDGALPTKLRVKSYEDGGYGIQISQRESRLVVTTDELPITITTFKIFERTLKAKEAEPIIKRFTQSLEAIVAGDEERAMKKLGQLNAAFLEVHEANPLPGFDQFVGLLGVDGNHLVPLYTNTKTKYQAEINLEGIPLRLQVRRVNYSLSPTDPRSVFEVEAEASEMHPIAKLKEVAKELADVLAKQGLTKDHYPKLAPDPCILIRRTLGEMRALK